MFEKNNLGLSNIYRKLSLDFVQSIMLQRPSDLNHYFRKFSDILIWCHLSYSAWLPLEDATEQVSKVNHFKPVSPQLYPYQYSSHKTLLRIK